MAPIPYNIIVAMQDRHIDNILNVNDLDSGLADKTFYECKPIGNTNATHSDETAIRFPAGSAATHRMHAAAQLVITASIYGSPAL